jgi:hypothetical protein
MMFITHDSALMVTGKIAGPGINFRPGDDETLELGSPFGVLASISGFGHGDFIDLMGIGKATSASFSGGVLHVNTAGGPLLLNFTGSYDTGNFALSSDHHGGTQIAWHT